ncbi:ComF family protein [Candidatus Dependentiae bacterium]
MQILRNVADGAKRACKCIKRGAQHISCLVYPSFCLFCEKLVGAKQVCCVECCRRIIPPATCEINVTETRKIKVYALGDYRGPLRRVLMGKFHGDKNASWKLATLLTQIPRFSLFLDKDFCKNSILVPVPLHWSREVTRGFNQAKVMAGVYSQSTGIPVMNLVVRSKRTVYQSLLEKRERRKNVKDAFALSSILSTKDMDFFKGKNFILVDDLCTTGETLRAVAKPLMKLKPASFSAAVVCRVL